MAGTSPPDHSSSTSELAGDIAGNLAGAALGGIVAGPVGALLGAALAPSVSVTLRRALASLYAERQAVRATEYLSAVQNEADLDEQRLIDRIGDPAAAEVLEQGLDAAIGAASEEKRRLLGRVVAAALRDVDDARLDESSLLVRTIDALEPVHLRTLVRIATAGPATDTHAYYATRLEGASRPEDLARSMPGEDAHLIGPILASLDRESLIVDAALGTYDYFSAAWELTAYGRRLLSFLADEADDGSLDVAEVVPRLEPDGQSWFAVAKNLGPSVAADVAITYKSRNREAVVVDLGTIPAGEHRAALVATSDPFRAIIAGGPKIAITVEWTDTRGRQAKGRFVALSDDGRRSQHRDIN